MEAFVHHKANMITGWILEKNLWPFLETAFAFVGVTPDEYDREAISHGVSGTDAEQNCWFSYSFGSTLPLSLELAQERESEVLFMRADSSADIAIKIGVIINVFESYRVTGR